MEQQDERTGLLEQELPTESLRQRLEKILFQGIHSVYSDQDNSDQISTWKILNFVGEKVLYAFQILSLCTVSYGFYIDNGFENLQNLLLWTRLDYVSFKFGWLYVTSIMVKVLVITIGAIFLLNTWLKSQGKKDSASLIYILRFFFYFLARSSKSPILIFLGLQISQIVYTENEVFQGFQLSEFGGEALDIFFAFLAFLLIIGISFIYEIGTSETRHIFSVSNIEAQSSADFSILQNLVTIENIILFCLMGTQHQIIFLISMAATHLFVSAKGLKTIPKYSDFSNKVVISLHFWISFIAFAFIVGRLLQNAGVTVFLSVLIPPIVFYLIFNWIHPKRMQPLIKPYTLQSIYYLNSQHEFQRAFRQYFLKEQEDHSFLIKAFSKYYNKFDGKSRRIVYWEVVYCYYNIKDIRLSLIKLAKILKTPEDFQTNYMIFKFKKQIESKELKYLQDIDFLNYCLTFNEVKKQDLRLSQELLYFLEQIAHNNQFTQSVKKIIEKVCQRIQKVASSYSDLAQRYNTCLELLKYYSNFAHSIIHDQEIVELTEQWIQGILQTNQEIKEKMSYFNQNNGIMIISGKQENLGTIIHANPKIGEILNYDQQMLVNRNLQDFIPPPYQNHNKYISRFLIQCVDSRVKLPRQIFVLDNQGYLVQVNINIQCTATTGWPFFLVIIQKKQEKGSIAVLSQNDEFIGVSKGACKVLNISMQEILGLNCSQVFPWTVANHIRFGESCAFMSDSQTSFYLQIHTLKVFRKQIKCLYILPDLCQFMPFFALKPSREESKEKYYEKKGVKNLVIEETVMKMKELQQSRVTFPGLRFPSEKNELNFNENTLGMSYGLESKGEAKGSQSQDSEFREWNKKNYEFEVKIKKYWKLGKIFIVLQFFILIFLINFITVYDVIINKNQTVFRSVKDVYRTKQSIYNLANYVRNLQLNSLDLNLDFSLNYFRNEIETRKQFLEDFISNIEELDSLSTECNLSENLYKKTFPIWENQEKEVVYYNFFNFLNSYLQSLSSWLQDSNQNDFKFIVTNGIYNSRNWGSHWIEQYKDCRISQIQDFRQIIVTIITWGFFFMLILFLAMSILLYYYQISVKKHWNMIWNLFQNPNNNLKSSLMERLQDLFNVEDVQFKPNTQKKQKSNQSLKRILYSVLRSFLICSINLGYIMILLTMVLNFLTTYIDQKVSFLDSLNDYQRLYSQIAFWTRESALMSCCSLYNSTLDFTPFDHPYQELKSLEILLRSTQQGILKDQKIMYFVSSELQGLMDQRSDLSKYLDKGIYSSVNMVYLDSLDIVNTGFQQERMVEFVNELGLLIQFQQEFDSIVVENSENKIDQIVGVILIFNIFATVTNVVIFFVTFRPYFVNEEINLKNRSIMFEIAYKSLYNA